MKITATNVYVGPNIYANFPVIRMVLDIGLLVEWPSVKCGREFTDGLQQALPSLAEQKRPPRWIQTAAARGLGVADPKRIALVREG